MLKMVDGTGIIGVDMICPLGVSTPQPPNYDRVELEGSGMLVLPNSLDAPLERLELFGNSVQLSTTGAQLLDRSIITTVGAGVSYYAIAVGGGKYTLSTKHLDTDQCDLFFFDGKVESGASSRVNGVNSKQSRTVESVDGYVTIGIRKGTKSENPLDFETMLNFGDKALLYEPYTGGKPSPSQEYQQEIKNVGKWNEGTQKYEVDVKVTGKNLFDAKKAKSGWITPDGKQTLVALGSVDNVVSDYIQVYPGMNYTSSASVFQNFYDSEKNFLNHITNASTSIVVPDNAKYMIVVIAVNKALVIQTANTLMINIGSSRTDFESYKEQTLTITSDRPITKWDRLVEQGGQIGWLYGSKIYVVTGNEVFESRDGYNIESYTNRYFILNDLLMENDALKPLAYMKCLRNVQYVYSANIFEEGFETNKNQFHIKLSNDRVGILASDDHAVRTAKFSEYMKKIHKNGNPIEILYATTDTVFLPLPQEEQNAIRALKTYYPTTVITVDGGELDPDIKVTYRKEI